MGDTELQSKIDEWKKEFGSVFAVELGPKGHSTKFIIRPDTRKEMKNSIRAIGGKFDPTKITDMAAVDSEITIKFQEAKLKRCVLSPDWEQAKKKDFTADLVTAKVSEISCELPLQDGLNNEPTLIEELYREDGTLPESEVGKYTRGVADEQPVDLTRYLEIDDEVYVTVIDGHVYVFTPLWEGDLERIEKQLTAKIQQSGENIGANQWLYSSLYEEEVVGDKVIYPTETDITTMKAGIPSLLFTLIKMVSDFGQEAVVEEL